MKIENVGVPTLTDEHKVYVKDEAEALYRHFENQFTPDNEDKIHLPHSSHPDIFVSGSKE